MVLGARLSSRMQDLGVSQSELARRVGLSQQTIHKLITGASRGSAHLHRIARELDTSPAWLTGETEDPAPDAPLTPVQPPEIAHVLLAVALPPERALARMFEALLAGMPDGADRDEQALLLARRLPTGLAQLRDLLPVSVTTARTSAPALATSDAERPA